MAYTVLARRYRSSTFDQVVGQEHIAQTLKRAIESGRIAHAYLFCGTRGTGKTSTARILAKCLNCQSADHPVTEPCNRCDSCIAIGRGEDIDVIEIDAASNTGVDDVRDTIIGTAYNMPARSRFKIFIIDEVHMLSKNAFNALLKTLEEPPSHVKFILATTEPEKVLPTILSRCQRYDFRNIPTREVAAHLKQICKTEQIDADDDALLLVAKAGAGSMRDALSLLDRLLSLGESKLTIEMIEQLLGLPRTAVLFNLCAAMGEGDVKGVLSQTEAVIARGLSVDTLVASLIDHLRNLLVLRTCGADSELVEVPGLSLAELASQAERFDPGALSQDIVILEELRRHVRQSQAGRALLDATLVRMTLADQFSSLEQLLDRAAGGSATAAPAQKKKPAAEVNRPVAAPVHPAAASNPTTTVVTAPRAAVVPAPVAPPAAAAVAPPQASPAVTVAPAPKPVVPPPVATEPLAADFLNDEDDDSDLPAVGRVWEGPSESLATIMARSKAAAPMSAAPAPAAPAPLSNVEPVRSTDLSTQQRAMLALLAEKAPGLHGIISQAAFAGVEDGQAVLRIPRTHETFIRRLDHNGKKDLIREAFSQVLQQAVGVRFEMMDGAAPAAVGAETPAARPAAPTRSGPEPVATPPPAPATPPPPAPVRVTDEMREQLVKENPLIRAVVEQFNVTRFNLEQNP